MSQREVGQDNSYGSSSSHENHNDGSHQHQEWNNGGAGRGQNRYNIPRGQRGGGFGSPNKQNNKFQQGHAENQHFWGNQSSPDHYQHCYQDDQQYDQQCQMPPPNFSGHYGHGNQSPNFSGHYGHGNQSPMRSPPGVMMGRGRGAFGLNSSPISPVDDRYYDQSRSHPWYRGNGRRDRSTSHDRRNERDRSWSRERNNRQGWRWDEDPLVMLSKTLSSILRHNAENYGLKLMKGGFLYVDEILHKIKKLRGFTIEDVKEVVKSNDKQRFTLEQDEKKRWKIRANQGHTIEVEDLDLKPITNADDFPVVIHGTYMESWEVIKHTGLSRMKRNHIHFAPGEPGENGVISGMRSSCQVMIYLDLKKALEDGLEFFLSSNNVILSPGDENGTIHPRYFAGAADKKKKHRLDFDPNSDTKTGLTQDGSDTKKGKKKRKKGGKNKNKDDGQSDCPSTDDSLVYPSKVQALDDESDTQIVFEETPTEDIKEGQSKPPRASDEVDDTGVLSKLKDAYADNEKDEEQPDVETVLISDVDFARCTVSDLIRDEPQFVIVIGLGDNLGSSESCMKELVIGANSFLYVFNLEDKNIMKEGRLMELLLHKNIKKVFCRIGEVSPSLIYEYDILLNGVPIWDLEILYIKLQGQLSDVEMETLKEMDFQKSLFKKWAKANQRSGYNSEDLDDLKQQAIIMYKMFPILERRMSSPIVKILKKEIYDQAMPHQDKILQEKIGELKLAQKEIAKKEKADGTRRTDNSLAEETLELDEERINLEIQLLKEKINYKKIQASVKQKEEIKLALEIETLKQKKEIQSLKKMALNSKLTQFPHFYFSNR